ncbi:MAG TPA: ribosome maturation factor RimM [Vulgatibacter sp.]|nr:ribosome maturation factor RimM [Vulgatibacter sp.]
MPSPSETSPALHIGRVARPHGVRGSVAVNLDNPESDSLFHVSFVRLEGDAGSVRYDVRRASPGRKGQVVLSLAGVDSVEAADALRGREVLVDPDQLPALGEREYWQRDLLDLQAFGEDGAPIGRVIEVVDTAEVPVLVLRGDGAERYVPFADPYVISIDLASRRIVVAPPEEAPP